MNLSKSLYTRGLQCTKSLWLKKYKQDVISEPDSSQKAVYQTGDKVGALACELFPNGKEIPYDDYKSKYQDNMDDHTRRLALTKIVSEIMNSERKKELELYKMFAKSPNHHPLFVKCLKKLYKSME